MPETIAPPIPPSDADTVAAMTGGESLLNQGILPGDIPKNDFGLQAEDGNPNYVPAWRRDTGEFVLIQKSQVGRHYEDVIPEGHSLAGEKLFTFTDPKIERSKGTIWCRLHKDHADRPAMDALGMPPCYKRGPFWSEAAAESHLRGKHADSYALLQSQKEQASRERSEKREEGMLQVLDKLTDKLVPPPPPPPSPTTAPTPRLARPSRRLPCRRPRGSLSMR